MKPIIHNLHRETDQPLFALVQEYNKRVSELEHAKIFGRHLTLKEKIELHRSIKDKALKALQAVRQHDIGKML